MTVPLHPLDRAALDARSGRGMAGVTWVRDPEFDLDRMLGHGDWRNDGSRFVPVGIDRTRSTLCLWVRYPDQRAPVVLFESEGRNALVADDLDVLFAALRRGYVPDVARPDDPFALWTVAQYRRCSVEEVIRDNHAKRQRHRAIYGDGTDPKMAKVKGQPDARSKTALAKALIANGWTPCLADLAWLADFALEAGRPELALAWAKKAWFDSQRSDLSFGVTYALAALEAGETPERIDQLATERERPKLWQLAARIADVRGETDEALQLRRRIDDHGWYGFTKRIDTEDPGAVQAALDALDPVEHPGWAEGLRRILGGLQVTDVSVLRQRLAATGSPEAHARLGLALVDGDPVEAYQHLEAAVMALPGSSPLTKRCFEALETLPEP